MLETINQRSKFRTKRGLDKQKKIKNLILVENLPSPHNNNNKVVIFAPLVREIASHPEQEY